MMSLRQAADFLISRHIACALVGDESVQISRVHTDTRTLAAGDLFVALRGERFDAHEFLPQARAAGAAAAIAERGLEESGLPGLIVPDAKRALGELAAAWRAQFDLPLIAVTGSNGKTTVTQMIASILKALSKEHSFATQGNLNNDIGVPLTLLRLRANHQIAVIELGMNHPGEIAYLSSLAQPTVAVVNNAQREHQEFMHTVEAVAEENGSVISALPADGVAVFPSDDAYSALWRGLAGEREQICFSSGAIPADVTGQAEWLEASWRVRLATPLGSASCQLRIAGRHNVKNALAASAAALGAGVPLATIVEGLETFEAVKGRSRALRVTLSNKTYNLIDDTYNANPDSVRAAIDILAELPAPHLLVLGDMGEVGDQGPEFHAEIGEYAAERGIETLLCMGELMRYGAAVFPGARHFAGIESLSSAVLTDLSHYRSVLVKGSRFMKMERIVQAIEAAAFEQNSDQHNNKETAHAA
ncbi:UDP-N-acetylmuramoyl-tripeptide--D-alanyl-D-alanine ligase [Variovorax sp. PCZ-1]|uniref:UDP-N-acetylmuramoyl-tripeptide--D-alanyl-D- alanine ligase n=1 Tax=Variovorax sp. PCZ-1 TaxID=2835533 RepID=UPI001BD0FB24|nr:UDP-N-acetylmuramoyl-tripeptide--D-alanyl-D-alanine ligase [Variovorax sp. PCZ-1]MBS7808148.1 UDP-N-acetylmuramoyl-tripeptide--D-alanyl-D-alanine ligase [Variovorax sp. PCZ-1]